uniref:Uncharacterized protein n=1 Tax=Arundo donax TaxID=35708 RepID=A0A0A8ZYQ8_ARUDO
MLFISLHFIRKHHYRLKAKSGAPQFHKILSIIGLCLTSKHGASLITLLCSVLLRN